MSTDQTDPATCDPKVRRQMIADSNDAGLEALRQHALATMAGLLRETLPGNNAHCDYAIWGAFVGEIEAEQQKRASKPYIETDDPELRSKLQVTYDQVRPYFDFGQDVRVLCFMAKGDDEDLLSTLDRQNRGFQLTLAKYYHPYDSRVRDRFKLPIAVTDLLHDGNGKLKYDHLVYLHGSTTRHAVCCALSLAHELQHVRQCEEHPDLFAESNQIKHERELLKKEFINLPHEKDAMFTSRRIAEKTYGRSKVNEYISEQLEAAQHLESHEAAYRESVIWNYQAKWEDTFSLKDEVESAKRQMQNR